MNNKIVWIVIVLVVIAVGFMMKKTANITLTHIGTLSDPVCTLGNCATLNYDGHLMSFASEQRTNLFDLDGNLICRDFNMGLYNLYYGPTGGEQAFIAAQYINNKVYLLIDAKPWGDGKPWEHKFAKCENIVWNCDLNNPSTCSQYLEGDCMDMLCTHIATPLDDIIGLCSDGGYLYGVDYNGQQLIKYSLQGVKLGTIPLDFGISGCEYQNDTFYATEYGGQVRAYDSTFVLKDTYITGADWSYYDLTQIGNRFYIQGQYAGNINGAHIYEISPTYDYTYFTNQKNTYLLDGIFQTFIDNSNRWITS